MKKQRYIVEIEMPDGDFIHAGWLKDLIQAVCDVEDESRQKVTVQETTLTSNLDEAAAEYAYTNWESDDYHEGAGEGLPFDAIGYTAKCFKAGAEWMAGQGISVEGDTDNGFSDEYYIRLEDYLNSLPKGTKLVFQIRKKQ